MVAAFTTPKPQFAEASRKAVSSSIRSVRLVAFAILSVSSSAVAELNDEAFAEHVFRGRVVEAELRHIERGFVTETIPRVNILTGEAISPKPRETRYERRIFRVTETILGEEDMTGESIVMGHLFPPDRWRIVGGRSDFHELPLGTRSIYRILPVEENREGGAIGPPEASWPHVGLLVKLTALKPFEYPIDAERSIRPEAFRAFVDGIADLYETEPSKRMARLEELRRSPHTELGYWATWTHALILSKRAFKSGHRTPRDITPWQNLVLNEDMPFATRLAADEIAAHFQSDEIWLRSDERLQVFREWMASPLQPLEARMLMLHVGNMTRQAAPPNQDHHKLPCEPEAFIPLIFQALNNGDWHEPQRAMACQMFVWISSPVKDHTPFFEALAHVAKNHPNDQVRAFAATQLRSKNAGTAHGLRLNEAQQAEAARIRESAPAYIYPIITSGVPERFRRYFREVYVAE